MHCAPEDRPTNISILDRCSLLSSLSAEQRSELASYSKMASADRAELLWLAGESPDTIAVIGTGFVKMTKNSPQGTETTVELVGPGQCIGVLAAIEGRDMPLNAVAVTPTWYLKVPTRLLMSLYDEVIALKDQVVRSIGPRLRKAHEMMSRLSSGTVEERLAAVLFIVAESYGHATQAGIELRVPLTRQDLSEMAGTTVETTIRVMSKWQKDGIVSTEHQIITICDQSRLEGCLAKI